MRSLSRVVVSSLAVLVLPVVGWTQSVEPQPPTQVPDRPVVQVASLDRSNQLSSPRATRGTTTMRSGGDPYGFAAMWNNLRARAGLSQVVYDASLSSWASQNNAAQCRRGLGHHVNPNCFQNCGWNYSSATDVMRGWLNSKGHRENLLARGITRFGIAYGPGPYWTLNAR